MENDRLLAGLGVFPLKTPTAREEAESLTNASTDLTLPPVMSCWLACRSEYSEGGESQMKTQELYLTREEDSA